MSCVWMLQRGHSGDGCVLASTLCKYDLRKGDLFVLSWARVRRVRRGSISSELLVCGGGVRSILLLPLVARCQETIDVCIWRMFVSFLLKLPPPSHNCSDTFFHRSFAYGAPYEWNKLDERVRRLSNFNLFKSEIKTVLFLRYFNS